MRDRSRARMIAGWTRALALAGIMGAGSALAAGRPLPPPCSSPLPPGPVLHQFDGVAQLDRFGYSVAFGDVNGDGKADIIVGAVIGTRAKSGAIDRPGYVKVFDGANPATVIYTFNGYHAGDFFGWRVAAGDVNGDGKGEIVAGAHVGDGGGLGDSGWVRVFDGATGTLLHQFNGTASPDHFGIRVATGDVNGDGQTDVIVGAEWGTLPGTPPGSGYVRVHDGATGAVLTEFNGSCDFADQFNGDHLGFSLAVHDVNGDGKVNILTGAPDGDAGSLDNGYVRLYLDTL
jgi:FG-GAP repeat